SAHSTAAAQTPPLSLHDALPISCRKPLRGIAVGASHRLPGSRTLPFGGGLPAAARLAFPARGFPSQSPASRGEKLVFVLPEPVPDRKSTRLNSSHVKISYAVFCL